MENSHNSIQPILLFLKLQAWCYGFFLYIDDLPDDVFCSIAICADNTTLLVWSGVWFAATARVSFWTWIWYVKHCFGVGDGLLLSMLEKLNCFFNGSNNTGAIYVKMNRSVLEEKSSFKMLELFFFAKLDLGSYIIFIAKTDSKKTGALIGCMKFILLRLLFVSVSLPYGLAGNTVIISVLVLQAATW